MSIQSLTADSITKSIQRDHPVLVDFWAYGCPPCDMIQPILEEESFSDMSNLVFAKINLDENEQVAPVYRLSSVPTLIVFEGGKEVERVVVPSEDELRALLYKYRS